MTLRLIVGLGNPTGQYEETRHNAGFQFLDRLAARERLRFLNEPALHGLMAKWPLPGGAPVFLLKPTTYMNCSGRAVRAAMSFYRLSIDDLLVVHDELDFPPGMARLKQGGGHGGHNGLRDIVAQLGSGEFRRLRLGIGRPTDRARVASYVLERASIAERQAMDKAIDAAMDVLPWMLSGDWSRVMNTLNSDR